MNRDDPGKQWQMNLAETRGQYEIGELSESDMDSSPFVQFAKWYKDAEAACRSFPNNMILSTVDENNAPFSRVVLLKTMDAHGFVFFTNYKSRKGQQLEANRAASITIFWPELERQVNISGLSEKVSATESDKYFAIRPRGSQIGAWVSNQSENIPSRETLTHEKDRLEELYLDREIPRPPHWGGFRIHPQRLEFWQGQPDRLHDRLEYALNNAKWALKRLAP
jgi:pyridoxamine 5'-phosphate oxidase